MNAGSCTRRCAHFSFAYVVKSQSCMVAWSQLLPRSKAKPFAQVRALSSETNALLNQHFASILLQATKPATRRSVRCSVLAAAAAAHHVKFPRVRTNGPAVPKRDAREIPNTLPYLVVASATPGGDQVYFGSHIPSCTTDISLALSICACAQTIQQWHSCWPPSFLEGFCINHICTD